MDMDLPRINLKRDKPHNLLHYAYHPILGLAWSDGKSVYISDINISGDAESIQTRQHILMSEFPGVFSVAWNFGSVEAYISLQLLSSVSIYRVTGNLHQVGHDSNSKKWALTRDIKAGASLSQGLLWNPRVDVLCILFENRFILYSYDPVEKKKFARAHILHEVRGSDGHGNISCGQWSKDGLRLIIGSNSTLFVYSWSNTEQVGDKSCFPYTSKLLLAKEGSSNIRIRAIESLATINFICTVSVARSVQSNTPATPLTYGLISYIGLNDNDELFMIMDQPLYELPLPHILLFKQNIVCASNESSNLNIIQLSNTSGKGDISVLKFNSGEVVEGVSFISPGVLLLMISYNSNWRLELRKISHIKGNICQAADVPELPSPLHHHPPTGPRLPLQPGSSVTNPKPNQAGRSGLVRPNFMVPTNRQPTPPHPLQTQKKESKANDNVDHQNQVSSSLINTEQKVEEARVKNHVEILKEKTQRNESSKINTTLPNEVENEKMSRGDIKRVPKLYNSAYPTLQEAASVKLCHPDKGVKQFLLDEGRLKFSTVINAFNLKTNCKIKMTDDSYWYVGANSEGYIPLHFSTDDVIDIIGDDDCRQVNPPYTLNKPVNLLP